MPASPATPRHSSKKRCSAPVTPARCEATSSKPLGLSDSNTVKDRIRQWQEQGAKVVSSPVPCDVSVAGDENADVEVPLSSLPRENEFIRGADTTPRRRSSRWVDLDKKSWVREPRSSSTPRKRVISDEHWKKKQKRSPKSGQSASRQEIRQEKHQSDTPKHTSSRVEREQRRQRRKNVRSSVESGTIHGEKAEIEFETTPPSPRRDSGKQERMLQSALDSAVDDDLPRRLQSIISPEHSVKERRKSIKLSRQTEDKPLQRSQYAEMLDRSPKTVQESFDGTTGSVRSRKGGIINQAKEMFSRTEPMQPVSQRLPSIEAWLDEQPDPFVDDNPGPVEIPAPLKTRSKKQKVDIRPNAVEDPNRIWDLVESEDPKPDRVPSTGQRRRRRSRKSKEKADITSPESADAARVIEEDVRFAPRSDEHGPVLKEVSPSGLKRRGAKALRARTGSSPVKRATPEYELKTTSPTSIPAANIMPEPHLTRERGPRPVKPCPPTGVHCLSTIASVETFQSQAEAGNDGDTLVGKSNGLQRRLTTHEDLMSVLSLPRAGGSIKSARSMRTAKRALSTMSLDDVLEELEVDEAKYMRELKTLVDGVIPVLLQCVLSKSDSATAAGLFSTSGSARDDLNFTKPIVDMGVALERLKTLHRRIPTRDLNSLLSWAQSARKVYLEYLKAWRLGFQDVVVNLAPPDGDTLTEMDEGMSRDENGDVVNSDGEKVDVAYLLKRPLVRIKKLAKAFTRIKILRPSSKALMVADQYDDLIKTARWRANEEQARLVDEVAANIDTTKARDVQTLAVLSGAKIDKGRRVIARDCFSLTIHHSSGQRLDCHTELFLRSNQPGRTLGGDLLICEVENNGKWLLFPPLETGSISARFGDIDGEVIIMVRGLDSYMHEWHELLLLNTTDLQAASEWVHMLPTHPAPPQPNRSSGFIQGPDSVTTSQDFTTAGKHLPLIPRSPSPREIEVPIGEPSIINGGEDERPRTAPGIYQHESLSSPHVDFAYREHSLPNVPIYTPIKDQPTLPDLSVQDEQNPTTHPTSPDTPSPGLRRAKGATRRHGRHGENDTRSPLVANSPTPPGQPAPSTGNRKISRTDDASREWMSSPRVQGALSMDEEKSNIADISERGPDPQPQRPQYHRAISSTPSMELPIVQRLRTSSPVSTPLTQSIQDQWSSLSGEGEKVKQGKGPIKSHTKEEDVGRQVSHPRTAFADDIPPPPHRSQSQTPSSPKSVNARPVPLPHRLSTRQQRVKVVPTLKLQSKSLSHTGRRNDRRSSSPLKHEYAPSTASGSDSSDYESITSSSSETSENEELERDDKATPLLCVNLADSRRKSKTSPPASLPNLPAGTLAPSNSASQAPYRTVPNMALQLNAPTSKTIATLYSWSQKGMWDSLYPDECSIVISPGLIEAFEMSAAHSSAEAPNGDGTISDGSSNADTDDQGIRPLVAFELTPLVPLRKGTALDISIRSPTTTRSKVKTSTNVMFRSRNAEECEALYGMMNYARINNPTYLALERARPREMPNVSFNTGPGSARHSRSGSRSRSWFGFGGQGQRSSYRASSAPLSGSPSIGGNSETSVGSMSSAFSALRRFSGGANSGKGMFNLNRSSVIRKNGRFGMSGPGSLYSSSSGTTRTGGSGSGATSPAPSQLALGPVGVDQAAATVPRGTVHELKVRLYVREGAEWRHMGAARLSVMPAPIITNENADGFATLANYDASPPGTAGGSHPPSTFVVGQPGQARGPRLPSSNHTPHRVHGNGNEKRIIVTGKKRGETLLDATLHESCFERVHRTGIAVSIWVEHEEVAKSGGVVSGKGRKYMIQTMGEAEAAWVFGMVGRLRY